MTILSTNTKVWLHGLFAAGISAFATSASGLLALPTVFNFSRDGMINMLKMALVPAGFAVFTYLKQSPLPSVIGPGDTLKTLNPVIASDGSMTADSATLQKAPAIPVPVLPTPTVPANVAPTPTFSNSPNLKGIPKEPSK